jgi:hypothetical protein
MNSFRPLVGFAVFDEAHINYSADYFQEHVSTFVHEVFHGLFFNPILFQNFPLNSAGETFLFQDSNGIWKLRGDNVLKAAREHFNCPSIDGGRFSLKIYSIKINVLFD